MNNNFNGQKPLASSTSNYKNVDIGEVVSITDPEGLDRIKVFVNGPVNKGGDHGCKVEDLPWCSPMVPKYFSSKPKVGETVFVFTFSDEKSHSDRLYMGPIISQSSKLNFDPKTTTGMGAFSFGVYGSNVDITRIPELRGVFHKDDDIAIQGRNNTDIIQRSNEVLLRAGKFVESKPSKNNPYSFSFNNKTQAYVQLKNDVKLLDKDRGSVANVVASKINLLTHKDGSPRFDILNQDNLISDEELAKILQTAHPLPFGDILIEYLKLLKNAVLNHVHNGNGRPPTDLTSGNSLFVQEFVKNAERLEKQMLSVNIKIN